jgi:hypothetical protein
VNPSEDPEKTGPMLFRVFPSMIDVAPFFRSIVHENHDRRWRSRVAGPIRAAVDSPADPEYTHNHKK